VFREGMALCKGGLDDDMTSHLTACVVLLAERDILAKICLAFVQDLQHGGVADVAFCAACAA
jgi:hypothetical protein